MSNGGHIHTYDGFIELAKDTLQACMCEWDHCKSGLNSWNRLAKVSLVSFVDFAPNNSTLCYIICNGQTGLGPQYVAYTGIRVMNSIQSHYLSTSPL